MFFLSSVQFKCNIYNETKRVVQIIKILIRKGDKKESGSPPRGSIYESE